MGGFTVRAFWSSSGAVSDGFKGTSPAGEEEMQSDLATLTQNGRIGTDVLDLNCHCFFRVSGLWRGLIVQEGPVPF